MMLIPFAAPKPASAQCQVRADWNIYTVVRGDSVSMIAKRFTTTTAILTQANCLPNANLIYPGQQLRVPIRDAQPPVYDNSPEYPPYTMQIGSSYQQFENGFMIWRGDNGSIWVFVNQTANGGYVMRFASNVYGAMTNQVPYPQVPAGRTVPMMGFKRIYDNFASLRLALGWGIGSERGLSMTVQPAGLAFTATIPDQRIVQINPNRTWQFISSTPLPYTTGATFQPFQNGFMTWRADNGEIYVFFGTGTGTLNFYSGSAYGGLPSLPPFRPFAPNSGFAKVWLYLVGANDRLGWPTGGEQGYTMTTSQSATDFTLPDGSSVQLVTGNQWRVVPPAGQTASTLFSGEAIVVDVPDQVAPEETEAAPIATEEPPAGIQVVTFNVTPTNVMPGDSVTVNWDVQGADSIHILARYMADYSLFLDKDSGALVPQGSVTIDIPTHPDVFNTDASFLLAGPDGTPLESTAIPVHIGCPYGLFWDTTQCGYEPAQEGPAIYQPFERGFMLLARGVVFTVVFDDAHTGSIMAEKQQVELGTPPEGLYAPDGMFVPEWTRTPQAQQMLGWATAPAQSYTATTQLRHYRTQDTTYYNYVSLPDGRVIELAGSIWGTVIRWEWVQ
jgi:LysM repeat protein